MDKRKKSDIESEGLPLILTEKWRGLLGVFENVNEMKEPPINTCDVRSAFAVTICSFFR